MNGTLIYAHRTMLPLEEDIRLKIPEHSRPGPDHLFERKLTLLLDDCHPGQVHNLEAVIFEAARPEFAVRDLQSTDPEPAS